MLSTLAWNSLKSRKKTVVLTFLSLVVSITVLISVEHLRLQAKESFNRSISGTDLIVGAPSGELNLLLYAVFRMGSPTNSIQYESYERISALKNVAWTIPIALGDSHRGYRVMGTTNDYFEHFSFGDKRHLEFAAGQKLDQLFDVIIGADVAETLQYQLGDKIVVAHGIGATSFQNHDNAPFTVTGILKRTGTPVDKTVHVSLKAIEAIHLSPKTLTRILEREQIDRLKPDMLTAMLVGLNSKFATFSLQRAINNEKSDRLMAVLPGVAMTQLWEIMGTVENLLRAISGLVLLASLFGLATMLLASMNERSVEIAVLRTLGASPLTLLTLIVYEAVLITVFAVVAAGGIVVTALTLLADWLASSYGLFLSANIASTELGLILALVIVASIIAALVPAIEAYRKGLQTQLTQ